jgi:hypothetical protein
MAVATPAEAASAATVQMETLIDTDSDAPDTVVEEAAGSAATVQMETLIDTESDASDGDAAAGDAVEAGSEDGAAGEAFAATVRMVSPLAEEAGEDTAGADTGGGETEAQGGVDEIAGDAPTAVMS